MDSAEDYRNGYGKPRRLAMSSGTMQRLYQQPTGESLYTAAMEVGKSG